MRTYAKYILPALLLAAVVISIGFVYTEGKTYRRTISSSNEREVKATIEAGFAKVFINSGKAETIFDADVTSERTLNISNCIDYAVRDRVGYLTMNTEEQHGDNDHGVHMSGFESSTWNTSFTDAVPISFDIQLGLGKGDFNFTGIDVKDLSISTGASSVKMRFDKPNKHVIEDLTIEAGLSKFESRGLGNARFKHLKFEGGVGSYLLDFSGKFDQEADVDIEVGLGSLTVIIPKNTGVKLTAEKNFITHFDIDDDLSDDGNDTYISSNYDSAPGKLNIHIDAGVGSVNIRRE